MGSRFLKCGVLLIGIALPLAFPALSLALKTYTVTIPDNTTCGPTPTDQLCVTMGDENFVTLPHRVSHTGDEKVIKRVKFTLPAGSAYNFSAATVPPSGWTVKNVSALSIEFNAGAGEGPGGFVDFDLVVTGAGDQAIPALASDLTEAALSLVDVKKDGGFTMQGSIPQWTRKSLAVLLIATPTTLGVGGTISVEMQVTNRSSATQNGIASSPDPPTRIYTGGASVSLLTGPINNPNPLNLAPGETGTITWTFQADATGTVTFEAFAQDTTMTASSITVRSGEVVIGDFTAAISMDSTSAVSGQTIQVTLTVTNNGSTALFNTILTLTPQGTAGIVCDSGLSQNLGTLGGNGALLTFIWNCTVTGSVGDTFLFSGQGAADGPVTTNISTTPAGTISAYSVTVSPTVIPSNSAPQTFSWTVYNQGNEVVKEVRIGIPSPCNSPCNGWGYSSGSPGANWTTTPGGNPVNLVTFKAAKNFEIPVGGSRTFSITFSSVPTVTSDTAYNFPVTIKDKKNNEATINTTVTVTGYTLTLSASPVSIIGDAASTSTITATLVGPSPVNKTITFTTTAGTLSVSSAVTVASGSDGVATVTLTSSRVCGVTDLIATVTGSYGNASGTVDVTFTAIGLIGNLSYVGGFMFERTSPTIDMIFPPISVDPRNQGYFLLNVQNTGCGNDVIVTGSSLAVGTDIYDLFSVSDPSLAPGEIATLQYGDPVGPIIICGGSGTHTPVLTIEGDSPLGTPYAGAYAPPGDPFPETVTVTGTKGPCIQIYDWRDVK